jgi:hypothetical protein
MPPRFGLGVRWLMPTLFDRDAGTDLHPVLHAIDRVFEVGVSLRGNHIGHDAPPAR